VACTRILHVEYAERGREYGILFIFSLFCESSNLEYVHIHDINRVHQAECVIYIILVAPQEYVTIYSTRRFLAGYMFDYSRLAWFTVESTEGVAKIWNFA